MFLEGAIGQDLHTQSNAASVANEANTTTGWSGTAVISSDNSNPQLGNFAIRMVSNTGNRYRMDYFYNATVGTDYVIRIWARQGPQVTLPAAPAFANWSGMSGFSTTPITSSNWTEYVFNVTATSSNPRITIYNGTSSSGNTAGNTVFIDNVSILPAGSDIAPPTAPTNLAASGTTSTGTTLNWTASTDNVGVTGYTILQNGSSIGTTNGATTFNVTGLFQNTSYAFTVTARDAAGNISPASNTANVTTQAGADNQPPTAPSNLAANGTTTTTTNLSWAASTDNVGVTGYTILQNGTSIGTTTGALTFNVTGLTQNTSYAFTVTARDAAGNISPVSNTANVTTLTAADGQAPTAPSNLTASGTTNTTTNLAWTASTDNVAVTGYNILQNGTSVGTTTGALTFNVTGLTQNTAYAFTVTARDAAGNVSPASNTANVTTTGGGIIDYTSANSNLPTVDWTARDLFASRNVGIGTTNTQGYRLAVDGNVVAEEIKVELSQNWPDFVFTKSYGLPTLEEVEQHILDKGHLQNIPSAMEVELNGIMLGEMNAKLLQKIEELTLYAIQQEKKIMKLENENKKIQLLSEKLLELEGLIKGNN